MSKYPTLLLRRNLVLALGVTLGLAESRGSFLALLIPPTQEAPSGTSKDILNSVNPEV